MGQFKAPRGRRNWDRAIDDLREAREVARDLQALVWVKQELADALTSRAKQSMSQGIARLKEAQPDKRLDARRPEDCYQQAFDMLMRQHLAASESGRRPAPIRFLRWLVFDAWAVVLGALLPTLWIWGPFWVADWLDRNGKTAVGILVLFFFWFYLPYISSQRSSDSSSGGTPRCVLCQQPPDVAAADWFHVRSLCAGHAPAFEAIVARLMGSLRWDYDAAHLLVNAWCDVHEAQLLAPRSADIGKVRQDIEDGLGRIGVSPTRSPFLEARDTSRSPAPQLVRFVVEKRSLLGIKPKLYELLNWYRYA